MIRIAIVWLGLMSFATFADDFKPVQAPLPPGRTTNQDLPEMKNPTLNGGDRFEVASYDPETRTYKLVLRADPSAGPLVTTAENLAKVVANIKLDKVLKAPYSLVRFDYTVENGKTLDLLNDSDIDARRAKSPGKTSPKGPEKPVRR